MGRARTRLPRETVPAIQHVLSRRVWVPALPQLAGAHALGALGSSCIWQVPSEGLPCLELPPRGEEPCLPWADSSVHLLRPALHSYAQHSPKDMAISLCVSLFPSKGGTLAGGESSSGLGDLGVNQSPSCFWLCDVGPVSHSESDDITVPVWLGSLGVYSVVQESGALAMREL